MILLGPTIAGLLGLWLAWIARAELIRSDAGTWRSRGFTQACAMAVFVWIPIFGYFYARHGDWTYLYVVSSSRIPSAVDLALVVTSAAVVPVGYQMGATLAVAQRFDRLWQATLGVFVFDAVFVAVLWRRLSVIATYAQYHGDFGIKHIAGTSLGLGLLVAIVAGIAAFALAAKAIVRPA